MGLRKFRKHKKLIKPEFIINLPVKKSNQIRQEEKCTQPNAIYITPEDRIVYIFEYDNKRKPIKIVDVSYDILIENKWITCVRFDSEHGYLHSHRKISLFSDIEVISTEGVKKRGGPAKWLTWAVEYIKVNYLKYRKDFQKNSKLT